jgi:hypothetical protein
MQVRSMGPISEMDMVSLTLSESFILENGEELWISSAIAHICFFPELHHGLLFPAVMGRQAPFLFRLQGKVNLSFPGYKVRASFLFRLQGKGHPFLFRLQGKGNLSFPGYKVRANFPFGLQGKGHAFLCRLQGKGHPFLFRLQVHSFLSRLQGKGWFSFFGYNGRPPFPFSVTR